MVRTRRIATCLLVESPRLTSLVHLPQELEASLATQTETVFTAKGEATVLRQTLEKVSLFGCHRLEKIPLTHIRCVVRSTPPIQQQESHSLALRNLMNQHADKMEKARKLEQQRKLEEEGRRAQSTFDVRSATDLHVSTTLITFLRTPRTSPPSASQLNVPSGPSRSLGRR